MVSLSLSGIFLAPTESNSVCEAAQPSLKGVQPPLPFGERTRDCSPGHAGKEGPQLTRTGVVWGLPRCVWVDWKDSLEEEMPAHSSVLAWRIPGMGEPGAIAPNPVESREAPPNSTVPLTSQRHPEKLHEVTGTCRGNPGFPAATQESKPCLLHLLHWQADSLPLEPTGKPS